MNIKYYNNDFEETKDYIFDALSKIIDFEEILWADDEDGEREIEEYFVPMALDDMRGLLCSAGCSKSVYKLKDDDDFVIKIPFNGYYEIDERIPFSGANCLWGTEFSLASEWDYCDVESLVYCAAESLGLEEFFAKTEYIGDFMSHPIYISKCAEKFCLPDYRYRNDYSKDIIDKSKKKKEMDYDIIACLILDHGEEKVDKLLEFINKIGLNDFHTGNFGIVDGKIRLIDYSGYCG